MLNTMIGMTAVNVAGFFDLDYIISFLMIVIGFTMMKKCSSKALITAGRLLFAVGTGMTVWMVLWQLMPWFMAELIYGMRI